MNSIHTSQQVLGHVTSVCMQGAGLAGSRAIAYLRRMLTQPDTSSELRRKHCVPCERGAQPLKGPAASRLLDGLDGWSIVDDHHLSKLFAFPDFAKALAFVNRLGALAEEQGHHPDIRLSWGKVEVELHTHAVGGLSENDFILAAKTDLLPR
jgi:4a-hydroxytetrahydrobiopterin dehydratase